VIDRWHPKIIMNLGIRGGFKGEISKGEIILTDRMIIYDIYEQMRDPEEQINHYITEIDNSWISKPILYQLSNYY
jgi:adenosylhomocysteine nucleosidase